VKADIEGRRGCWFRRFVISGMGLNQTAAAPIFQRFSQHILETLFPFVCSINHCFAALIISLIFKTFDVLSFLHAWLV